MTAGGQGSPSHILQSSWGCVGLDGVGLVGGGEGGAGCSSISFLFPSVSMYNVGGLLSVMFLLDRCRL